MVTAKIHPVSVPGLPKSLWLCIFVPARAEGVCSGGLLLFLDTLSKICALHLLLRCDPVMSRKDYEQNITEQQTNNKKGNANMNRKLRWLVVATSLGATAWLVAQDNPAFPAGHPAGPRGPPRHPPPPPPLPLPPHANHNR